MPRVSLGDVAREVKQRAPEGAACPSVGLEHLDPDEIELSRWNEDRENTFTKSFSRGQVLFGRRRAYLRKAAVAPFDGVCSGDITVIEARETLSPRLLPFIIQNEALFKHAVSNSAGSLSPRVKWQSLAQFEFNLPARDQQEKLADLLWTAQDTRNHYKQLLSICDDVIKSQFVEMFGDPYTNSKDYPLKKGESFFKLSNGKAVPESKRLNGGIPAYGGNGISWYTDESLFDADTIVVGRVGFQSGNVHLVTGPLWVTDNAMYMSSCDFSQYNLTFLIELMAHVDFTKFQDAGDLKKITQKPFMQFEYLCPPLSLQNQFSAFVAEVDKSKLLVGSAAAHKPFDIGFFSQKHCATPCKRGIISSKHVIFH